MRPSSASVQTICGESASSGSPVALKNGGAAVTLLGKNGEEKRG